MFKKRNNPIDESKKIKKNNHKMNKLSRIKKALARFVAEAISCGNVTTDKGILAWDGEEDLAEGMPVFL